MILSVSEDVVLLEILYIVEESVNWDIILKYVF